MSSLQTIRNIGRIADSLQEIENAVRLIAVSILTKESRGDAKIMSDVREILGIKHPDDRRTE